MTAERNGSAKRRSPNNKSKVNLNKISDNDLLSVRMCDLGVSIDGTQIQDRLDRVYGELESNGIRFRPHAWLSDEWFTPDGVPGIAIPFYLTHPRLMRLESKQMLEVEGGTESWCLKIMRHEIGHAIDNAYRLRRRREWREVFGPASKPYPKFYQPKPYSKKFVLHLDMWYAQSHPVEDFAETFAVWLKPRSRWRKQYRGWPALKKLEYVDHLMNQIADQRPKVTGRERVDSLPKLRKTLKSHYDKKRRHYEMDRPNIHDRDLRRLFSDAREHRSCPSAAAFLRRHRVELRKSVAFWTGQYQYTIDQVLNEMIECCRDLNLRLHRPEHDVEQDLYIMLTVQTMNFLNGGHQRVAL